MTQGSQLIASFWESVDERTPLFFALTKLSPQGQRAIYLRFWENYTIEEISNVLKLTWDQADRLIESSLKELKTLLADGSVIKLQEAG